MVFEWPWLLAWGLLAFFIALPALAAWRRRRVSREASEIAAHLASFAVDLRQASQARASQDQTLQAALRLRLLGLGVPDAASLQLAEELGRGGRELVAEAAQRLALRLRRRVAFERKMLARTAPGLRRGALAALMPPAMVLLLSLAGLEIPRPAQLGLWSTELIGCVLLWRLARVEI